MYTSNAIHTATLLLHAAECVWAVHCAARHLGAHMPRHLCRDMLTYIDGTSVTKNAAEKKINSLLDFMSSATDVQLLQVGGAC